MRDKLESKGKRELRIILKAMRSGSIGFDTEKKSKSFLIDTILDDAESYTAAADILNEYMDAVTLAAPEPSAAVFVDPVFVDPAHQAPAAAAAGFDALIDARIKQLIQAGVSVDKKQVESLIKTALESVQKPRPDVIIQRTNKTISTDGKHPAFADALFKLEQGDNILLVGPAGCGKTHLAAQLAEALDIPFSAQACTAGTQEHHILGGLLPTGEAGRFEVNLSAYAEACKNGGLHLFDEFDMLDENCVGCVHMSLAQRRLDIPGLSKPIMLDATARAIGTANTLGNGADMVYTGRNPIDAATKDRFAFVTMDYDPTLEQALVSDEVYQWGKAIRKQIRDKNIFGTMLTTRGLIRYENYKRAGKPVSYWNASYYASWTKDQKSQAGVKI